jgi:hypothetical protein
VCKALGWEEQCVLENLKAGLCDWGAESGSSRK